MFPYPSGLLHMGHVRVYSISDAISRARQMMGYEVLHPMGWDGFGLPAENAAIDRRLHPSDWTTKNIAQMKDQMNRLGYSFDWDREVATCSPEYYRWTQWIFLQMAKSGLVYRKNALVNWDPVDQTVLANEQIDAQGNSWRSGARVEKKWMKQWFLKITKYAESLHAGLENLRGRWPSEVIDMQREWIGRSEGLTINFKVDRESFGSEIVVDSVSVFTTSPETLFGCTYIAVSPHHPLAERLMAEERRERGKAFVCQVEKFSSDRPSGFFTGAYVIHPISGKKLPIYLAEYVLAEYASGAVMGVPAHDARDRAFSIEHHLPAIQVLQSPAGGEKEYEFLGVPNVDMDKWLLKNSEEYSGRTVPEVRRAIEERATLEGWGKRDLAYALRDWLISRQRYWGTPIPIIHCPSCGPVTVPEDELPVTLPAKFEGQLRAGCFSPLSRDQSWVRCTCPTCGCPSERETDTMDTFVDSSWYFLRFPDSQNSSKAFSPDSVRKWFPVSLYIGGIEHAILHLLYARFVTRFLHERGLIPEPEPFSTLRTQGMVHGKTYRLLSSSRVVPPDQVQEAPDGTARLAGTGEVLKVSWEKMSKSKYNGVDPQTVIAAYGADTVRVFLLFKAPIERVLNWDAAQIAGPSRWLKRIWNVILRYHWLCYRVSVGTTSDAKNSNDTTERVKSGISLSNWSQKRRLHSELQSTIRLVSKDFESYSLNVAISRLMRFTGLLAAALPRLPVDVSLAAAPRSDEAELLDPAFARACLEPLLVLLAPIAPHFASEAWQLLRSELDADGTLRAPRPSEDIFEQSWPQAEPEHDQSVSDGRPVTLSVHISGVLKGKLALPIDTALTEQTAVQHVKNSPKFQKILRGKTIKKIVYISKNHTLNLCV
ncbi:leucine--tRNA ligase-like [Schistocerca gregaria]|uniref:leucine--tRNA ligase-like n=1 Tax=Schistocerca gregaria TaxID=7010 RepID=UPI00211E28C9|nr:leucine--tRNA ligase-like [Schistocerca gregaria]